MKITKEQVEQNRTRVIDTAASLFRERGIDGIGIADLMKAAGMTHGGFYRQFKSKDDLAVQAVSHAVELTTAEIADRLANARNPLQDLVRFYVSQAHRDEPAKGCSLAALATDSARSKDPALQSLFGELVDNYIILLASLVPDLDPATSRNEAIAILAAMVGSLILSRAVPDPTLSDEILDTVATDLVARHGVVKPD